MNVILYSPVDGFGRWDYSTPDTIGLGGSETSHIQVATSLARRGYNVYNYSPVPESFQPCEFIHWEDCSKVDFSIEGIWIVYRAPNTTSLINKNSKIWIVCQDVDYPGEWSGVERIDKVFALCDEHAKYLISAHPELKGKIYLWSNGVRMPLIRQVYSENIERNPKRLMYASSPDRGLSQLSTIFQRARERVPDLELHVYYGFQGIKACADRGLTRAKNFISYFSSIIQQPGITFHDRVPQIDLYRDWMKSGLWCFSTKFSETSCITSMEAQCLGAIPITNPYWALKQNVKHGVFIPGDNEDKLIQARYVEAIVMLSQHPELQEKIRKEMSFASCNIFNWERMVDCLESHLLFENGIVCTGIIQALFQHRNASGDILNVGCGSVDTGWKSRGAVNVDICEIDPDNKLKSFADIIADARDLPSSLYGRFDTVVLGDILEHFSKEEDVIKVLTESKKCLNKDGRVIITVPDDDRPPEYQRDKDVLSELYTYDSSIYHNHKISDDKLREWFKKANLNVSRIEKTDYTFCEGWGAVCY